MGSAFLHRTLGLDPRGQIKRPSQRNEAEETTSEKEEMVEEGERVWGLKILREVE